MNDSNNEFNNNHNRITNVRDNNTNVLLFYKNNIININNINSKNVQNNGNGQDLVDLNAQ